MKEAVIKNMEEIRDEMSCVNLQLFTLFGFSSIASTGLALLSLYLTFKHQNVGAIASATFSGISGMASIIAARGMFGSVNKFHDELCDFLEKNENIADEESPLIVNR